MNFNLYLPNDLGEQAKDEKLKLSRLLRDAVVRELHRRSKMSELLTETQVYEVELSEDWDSEGEGTYTGLITGKLVFLAPWRSVFVTDDKRVIVYYGGDDDDCPDPRSYFVLDAGASERDLVGFLRQHLPIDFEFAEACRAFGVRRVVEL